MEETNRWVEPNQTNDGARIKQAASGRLGGDKGISASGSGDPRVSGVQLKRSQRSDFDDSYDDGNVIDVEVKSSEYRE